MFTVGSMLVALQLGYVRMGCFYEDPWDLSTYSMSVADCIDTSTAELPIWYLIVNLIRRSPSQRTRDMERTYYSVAPLIKKGGKGAEALVEVLSHMEWDGDPRVIAASGYILDKIWGSDQALLRVDKRLKLLDDESELYALKCLMELHRNKPLAYENAVRGNTEDLPKAKIVKNEKPQMYETARAVRALWGSQIGLSLPGGAKSSPAWKTGNEPEIIDYSMGGEKSNHPFVVAVAGLVLAAGVVLILVWRRRSKR